jgi:hypothetical protein
LAIVALIWLSSTGLAQSITVEFAQPHEGKSLTIEKGLDQLFKASLQGKSLIIDSNAILPTDNPSMTVAVIIENFDELAIDINLFRCAKPCKWRLALTPLAMGNWATIQRICQNNPSSMNGRFEKYFFCRKAYHGSVAAGGTCWREAKAALSGWFDAAYNLHALTLKDGIGFVARDTTVEAEIEMALEQCEDLEESVRRNKGYFRGMINNLDKAILEQAQRVQRLETDNRETEARGFAEKMVEQLQSAAPLRDLVSARDTEYVESVLNHALGPGEFFRLR